MQKLIHLLFLFTLFMSTLSFLTVQDQPQSPTPPIFNYSYQVNFKITRFSKKGNTSTTAKLFYDPIKKGQRIDWANGRHDTFCGSILPNVDTPCISLTINDKRWQIFPQRSQCCMCCTADKGCGILRPDWMKDGQYQGQFSIDGVKYDKFHKTGATSQDYVYVSQDTDQIERRLEEESQNGGLINDYDLKTFEKRTLQSSVFALPSYCHEDQPKKCPLTSICSLASSGLFKQKKNRF